MSLADRAKIWAARPLAYKVEWFRRSARVGAYKMWCRIRGYDFDGFIDREQLGALSVVSVANAGAYQAYPVDVTINLVQEALAIDPNLSCFVDVGCGKGKQCHYVAKRLNFDKIVGIDFSPTLIRVAKKNLNISGQKHVRYEIADAADWLLPDLPCVVFLYNSFDAPIMRAFLSNNMAHFAKHGSILAYGNDRLRAAVQDAGFVMLQRSVDLNNSLYRVVYVTPI